MVVYSLAISLLHIGELILSVSAMGSVKYSYS